MKSLLWLQDGSLYPVSNLMPCDSDSLSPVSIRCTWIQLTSRVQHWTCGTASATIANTMANWDIEGTATQGCVHEKVANISFTNRRARISCRWALHLLSGGGRLPQVLLFHIALTWAAVRGRPVVTSLIKVYLQVIGWARCFQIVDVLF